MTTLPITGVQSRIETGEAEAVGPMRSLAPSVATGEKGSAFADTLAQSERVGAHRPLVRHEAEKVSPLQEFEAFALRNFVESMLPDEKSTFFGSGTAGSIWRSMLAEHLGASLAENGGIGIADIVSERDARAGAKSETSTAPRSAPAADILARLSTPFDLSDNFSDE